MAYLHIPTDKLKPNSFQQILFSLIRWDSRDNSAQQLNSKLYVHYVQLLPHYANRCVSHHTTSKIKLSSFQYSIRVMSVSMLQIGTSITRGPSIEDIVLVTVFSSTSFDFPLKQNKV